MVLAGGTGAFIPVRVELRALAGDLGDSPLPEHVPRFGLVAQRTFGARGSTTAGTRALIFSSLRTAHADQLTSLARHGRSPG